MLKWVKHSTVFFLWVANLAFAQPKNIQLEYAVTRDGKPFAVVKESFTQEGKQYRILSTTKGIGVYALFGERVITSEGEVTTQGLKPMRFELHRGDNAKKSLLANFDWPKKTLNMQSKGKIKTVHLLQGTQDLASYAYQFMFSPPLKSEIKVAVTTGKKLNQYKYKVANRGLVVKAAGIDYKTVHLTNVLLEDKDKKELWLSEQHSYIPVRYRLIDENGDNLEQTLTKLHVE
ncbi:MAG: DUF3108 domain-containing protein [Methylophilaceae bacterium]